MRSQRSTRSRDPNDAPLPSSVGTDADRFGGLRRSVVLILAAALAGLLHHLDHVLRVDHSGWPFRADVTPFTYSLLAYPIVLFALFGPRRLFRLRLAVFVVGVGFTLFAHTLIETPAMQYAMWADDRSIDPHDHGSHNLLGLRSEGLGIAAVALGMTLNLLLVASGLSMLWDGLRGRGPGRPPI